MLRPSPNHGTQRLPNDDDDEQLLITYKLYMYGILPPPCIFTCSPILGRFSKKNQNVSWTNPHTNFQSYLGFFEFFQLC